MAGENQPRIEIKGRPVIQGRCVISLEYFKPSKEAVAEMAARKKAAEDAAKAGVEANSDRAKKEASDRALADKLVAALK